MSQKQDRDEAAEALAKLITKIASHDYNQRGAERNTTLDKSQAEALEHLARAYALVVAPAAPGSR